MHIDDAILDEKAQIDPYKIDLVARMGGDWYCRANGDALFEVAKPITTIGIGVDSIPESIRFSEVLTGNNLGQLGNVEKLPTAEEIENFKQHAILELFDDYKNKPDELRKHLHIMAKNLLAENKVAEAWKVLLSSL